MKQTRAKRQRSPHQLENPKELKSSISHAIHTPRPPPNLNPLTGLTNRLGTGDQHHQREGEADPMVASHPETPPSLKLHRRVGKPKPKEAEAHNWTHHKLTRIEGPTEDRSCPLTPTPPRYPIHHANRRKTRPNRDTTSHEQTGLRRARQRPNLKPIGDRNRDSMVSSLNTGKITKTAAAVTY